MGNVSADTVKTHAVSAVLAVMGQFQLELTDTNPCRFKFGPNGQIDHWGIFWSLNSRLPPSFIHSRSLSFSLFLTLLLVIEVPNWWLVVIKMLIWIKEGLELNI